MDTIDRAQPSSSTSLSDAERKKILYTWNDTGHDYPRHSTLHDLITAHARRTPESIAVTYEGESLTYAELDRRSSQLAHHLRHLGVGVETLVGLYVHRSLEMIVGIIGIMKAGGAYVPIDPDLPAARIQLMIDDAHPPVLLTQENLLANLNPDAYALLCLDTDWPQIAQEPTHSPSVTMSSENLAYVIYTSGSTGKPKGAQNIHRSIVNMVNSMARRVGIGPADHILATTTLSFDPSVWEIFLPLTTGARLTVASRAAMLDGAMIQRIIDETGVTFMRSTPSGWRLYLETGWRGGPDLKILSGGEKLSLDLAQKLQQQCAVLWHSYGPAEAAVFCTMGIIPSDAEQITIGKPHDNIQIYILDEHMQPVPVGVIGELTIGGDGVGRGYHNRPELTAATFIPNPFIAEVQGRRPRMYKTGDRAHYLPDGQIVFIGRDDSQVKIRGRRIELGEIDAAIRHHPAIAQNVTLALEDAPGDLRLVTYLIAEPGQKAPDARDMREFLRRTLPDYMLPAHFVRLDRFPVSPNGKIDRRALPAPDSLAEELTSEFAAPRSVREQDLADLFAHVLNLGRVSISDSFFELGGSSLLAARLLFQVQERFQRKITLRDFLLQPTVAGLSELIAADPRPEGVPTVAPEQRELSDSHGAAGALQASNLTRSQHLMWLGQQIDPDVPLYNVVHALTIHGQLDITAFRQAFQALVDHHDALRTVFVAVDGVPQQKVLDDVSAVLELIDFSAAADPDAAYDAFLAERQVRLLPMDQPLFDSVLLKLAEGRFVVYICQHHILTDAVSSELIFERLGYYYQMALDGRLHEIPQPPQYAGFVRYERELRQTAEFQQAAAYWQDKYGQSLPPTEFYGKSTVEGSTHTTRVIHELGAERSAKLRAIARLDGFRSPSEDLSLFTIFATLLFTTLHRLNSQSRLRLGTPFHGRPTADSLDIIGLFIEMGVMQVDIEEGETFSSLGEKVMAEILDGIAHMQPGVSSATTNRAYDVILNYIQASVEEFAGLPVSRDPIHAGHIDAAHNLRLQIADYNATGAFTLLFDMKTALFGETERTWLVQHFLQVVDAFISDHKGQLGGFSLLTEAQRQQLLVDFNATDAPYPSGQTVVQLFEEQAARTPAAAAVVQGAETVTYAELNRRANRLAHFLQAEGIGPETAVPICMDRSIDVLVAIWGTLKAGAAYIPVDPSYPQERLTYMLADAGAPVALLNDERILSALEAPSGMRFFDLSALDLSAYAGHNPVPAARPDNLVYMIYTSGSTGQPKGTMLTHQGLMNYVCWARSVYQDGEPLDFPLYSSLAFDLTVTSLFVPLLSGGKVVVYGDLGEARGLEILSVFEDDDVDIVKLTPAHLQLVRESNFVPRRIRKLIVGGEDFKTELARSTHTMFGGNVEMYNEYGPTEAVVGSMIHRFDPAQDTDVSVPIGTPAANARIYLLDGYDQPVPPGVTGEMIISSDGVARGYHQQPDLTAQRFGPDPFRPAARIYRTGDIARWNEHGQMVFLGRRDHQVKIKGARIELGEIEAALLAHPQLETAVVDVVQNKRPALGEESCLRCGLPASYPAADIDAEGLCADCRAYDHYRDQVDRYFRTPEDLEIIFNAAKRAKADQPYDSMVLLSGGKDSTYLLYQVVREYGLRPLVFSLDNGYISQEAIANMRRMCDDLGVDLKLATTPHMNAIFADSLHRHSNVCDGCYKVIYTLSMTLAKRHNIDMIITGLARGQLFETRLADTFRAHVFDPDSIDDWILQARKAYHQIPDAVTQLLDTQIFADERIFDEIQFVDFYRFVDVGLDEVYTYLTEQTVWQRPSDTGRSTNCLINDAGIYIHQKERGYHNYALPYSWDVRLGHKNREMALYELDDDLDLPDIRRMLSEIGYDENEKTAVQEEKRLAAYYVAGAPLAAADLRAFLAQRLPDFMIPASFTQLEEMPLTSNGKIDRAALPDPGQERPDTGVSYAPATDDREQTLVDVWSSVFRLPDIGINDNFFDLGGDSIISIQIVARARQAGLRFAPRDIFEHQTIAELAAMATQGGAVQAEQGLISGSVPLTPVQHWFFTQDFVEPQQWNQSLWLDLPPDVDVTALSTAVQHLPQQHDALRLRYTRTPDGWRQSLPRSNIKVLVHTIDLAEISPTEQEAQMRAKADELEAALDLEKGRLLQVGLFLRGPGRAPRLFITIHHLAVDGISWRPLLEDLETAYNQIRLHQPVKLPPKSSSFKQWAEELSTWAHSAAAETAVPIWLNGHHPERLFLGGGQSRSAEAETVSVALPADATQALLQDVPGVYNTNINDALLAATALAFNEILGQEPFGVMLEGHGREEEFLENIDLSRTVGWFTTHHPVFLRVKQGDDPGTALKAVKEQLRQIPDYGIAYGLLRYLRPDSPIARQPEPAVLFNYMGQFERSLSASDFLKLAQPLRASYGLRNHRTHPLEINAGIQHDQLKAKWIFIPEQYSAATVQRLASSFISHLQALIAHCLAAETTEFTRSDFDLIDLDDDQFDRLAGLLGSLEA